MWELLPITFDIKATILPRFSEVVLSLDRHASTLWTNSVETLTSAALGFLIALLLALIIGTVSFLSATVRDLLAPLVVFSQVTPKVAIAPLIFFAVGEGPATKIVLASVIAFFPMLTAFDAGLRSVPRDFVRLFTTFRASPWQTFVYLRLPYSAVWVLSAAKVSYLFAVIGAITVEFIQPSGGLGYLVLSSASSFQPELGYLAVIASALLGVLGWSIITIFENRVAEKLMPHIERRRVLL